MTPFQSTNLSLLGSFIPIFVFAAFLFGNHFIISGLLQTQRRENEQFTYQFSLPNDWMKRVLSQTWMCSGRVTVELWVGDPKPKALGP